MSTILGFIGLGFFTQALSYIPWGIIFLITKYIGINLYVLKRKEECQLIQKRVNNKCSRIMDDGKGAGFSIGFWYIMHIDLTNDGYGDSYNIWIISTKATYEDLIKNSLSTTVKIGKQYQSIESEVPSLISSEITILGATGSFNNTYFIKRKINLNLEPVGKQQDIINTIIDYYNIHKHAVVLLHGPVGTGKSMIARLIAKQLKGKYCNTANFIEPGLSMVNLYQDAHDADSDEKIPLILSMNEVHTMIPLIHAGIERHKLQRIQFQNTTAWNDFFDDVQIGMFPNTIFILTSNKSPEEISKETHECFVRKGRIDLFIEMNDNILEK
jgi:hypothetical protein